MNKHIWHDEIVAWADDDQCIEVCKSGVWYETDYPDWHSTDDKFRIKPQPKQPKFVYLYKESNGSEIVIREDEELNWSESYSYYIGKIEVQDD